MRSLYFVFSGVSCCERLSALELERLLSNSSTFAKAPSLIQADILIVLGHISRKQIPLLKHVWSSFSYPARCIHITGCSKAIESYALLGTLSSVVKADATLDDCALDMKALELALKGGS